MSWQLRGHWLYFQKMTLGTKGDEMERREARQYLQDQAIGTSDCVIWDMKCIFPMTIIVPNILPTVYLSVLKHLKDW